MPVSGLVVICNDREEALRRELDADARCTVGPRADRNRVPVVVETETHDAHREALHQLRQHRDVAMVELVYADYRTFSPDSDSDSTEIEHGATRS